MNDLTISIVSYNTKELTLECLESVFNSQTRHKFEVFVVDNASSDSSLEAIKKQFPKVNLIENKENIGFGKAHNLVFEKCQTNYLLLLNSDTKIEDFSLDQLVDIATKKNFGLLAPKLINQNRTLQPNFGKLPTPFYALFWLSNLDTVLNNFIKIQSFHTENPQFFHGTKKVGWVSGAVMLIKKDSFKKIGLFDPKIFLYAEDVELCWKAHDNDLQVGWTDSTTIMHSSGASTHTPKFTQWRGEFEGLLYLYKKHYGLLMRFILRIMIYFFVFLRIIAFAITGKLEYSKTYAKVITSI